MSLGYLDIAVLATYFVLTVGIGLWAGRRERNTTDFFLGGRRQHWFVVGLSIVATEVSALTFLIVPGRSFADDWWYLQLYVGAFVGRILIAYLLLPAFYGGSVTTVYEYLGQRFGPKTRTTASLMFVASRVVGSGFRLLAASLAIAILFDWPLVAVIVGVTVVAVAYTASGGIKAIIWTDALQAIVFIGAGLGALFFLLGALPGTIAETIDAAASAGKMQTFRWGFEFNNDKLFWILFIHAIFANMAALGVDQDLTQRMLTCPNLRDGQRSLIFNALAGLPIVVLFLLIGSLIHVYYAQVGVPPIGDAAASDRVFSNFIATAIPAGSGLKGLLVAGIFAAAMSSLDSALGALSSSAVIDFYKPWRRWRCESARAKDCGSGESGVGSVSTLGGRPPNDLVVARWCTVGFGALLAGAAITFSGSQKLLEDAFGWVGLIFGGLLGVFLLGVTTHRRGSDRVNVAAMLTSVAALALLKYVQGDGETVYIAWPWWVVLGTGWTYSFAALARGRGNRPGKTV